MRSQRLDHVSDLIDHFHKFRRLCRGNPGKLEAAGLNPHIFNKVFKQGKFSSGIVITFQVMAISGMSPGHPYAVRALPEGSQNEFRAHPTCTRDSNHPDVRRIFHPADPCKISGTITAPVA